MLREKYHTAMSVQCSLILNSSSIWFFHYPFASQPSVRMGNIDSFGKFRAPTTIVPTKMIETIAPLIAPFVFTRRLSIPAVKRPRSVPEVIPATVVDMANIWPAFSTRNTANVIMMPKNNTIPFEEIESKLVFLLI